MDTGWPLLMTIQFSLLLSALASSPSIFCPANERSALLELKKSFFNKTPESCYYYYYKAYRKIESWKMDVESGNCCAWDGIECDVDNGHVMAVELGDSCLSGTVSSNTTLFHLVQLQRLNLSRNWLMGQVPPEILKLTNLLSLDLSTNALELKKPNLLDLVQNMTKLETLSLGRVNISAPIPNILANLSSLRSLTLDHCSLQGEFPPNIFKMPKLEFLDLSSNTQLSGHLPEFHWRSSLKSLRISGTNFSGQLSSSLGTLTSLNELFLDRNNFIGQIPSSLGNLTQLKKLFLDGIQSTGGVPFWIRNLTQLSELTLRDNQLTGAIPSWIGRLSNLEDLSLYGNMLKDEIPSSLGNLTQLRSLDIGYNQLTGEIPSWIGQLSNLEDLFFSGNMFKDEIPSSLGNLTQLRSLDIGYNQLTGEIPSSIGQLSNLQSLDLSSNKLVGEIPSSFVNLTQLTSLVLESNQLSGQILPHLTNLIHLAVIRLSSNNFTGPIPSSITKLKNLIGFDLHSNSFYGKVHLSMFLEFKSLFNLQLSFNKVSLVDDLSSTNANLTYLMFLGLASCNLSSFPSFLHRQDRLAWVDLSHNNISGEMPEWFMDMNIDSLMTLNLSSNSLTSSPHEPINFRWKALHVMDLRGNYLEGSLPIPSASIEYYLVSQNKLSGEIPKQICELSNVEGVFLDENNFTGLLPQCLNNLTDTLSFLSLQGNNFYGEIPPFLSNGECKLRMLDLSSNRFHGPLPRSLVKCSELEFLNLGSNQIKDVFPSWLGSLSNLRVIILHSNEFHGPIGEPNHSGDFASLQIIDLSTNNFTSCLPSKYFESWKAMKFPTSYRDNYMGGDMVPSPWYVDTSFGVYDYSITIIIKGIERAYPNIQSYLIFVDLSMNNFTCEIPSTIGSLLEIQFLNISNNRLVGNIPSFLNALTNLQALDLSQNKLHGKIPEELAQLNFLGTFNVSYNNLYGRIPEGRHFDTFNNDSYIGNKELCGLPLSKKCDNVEKLPQPESKVEDEESIDIDWKVVLMGFGSGLVIGAIIGQSFTIRPPSWVLKYFGRSAHYMRSTYFYVPSLSGLVNSPNFFIHFLLLIIVLRNYC